MSEQVRSTKSRPYRMRRRAELVDGTRQRIVEAAVRLHTTIGPANTSISNVAEEADVTRLTVYRHFSDIEVLFDACRGHWISQHRPPDFTAWRAVPDLEDRARRGLGELYAWFGRNGDDLFPINRDRTTMPAGAQAVELAQSAALAGALVEGHLAAGRGGHTLRAVAGHLVNYWTWRSLVVEQRLATDEAVELAVRILTDAADGARPKRDRRRPTQAATRA
jgi:AcrR family transcriptional regulator